MKKLIFFSMLLVTPHSWANNCAEILAVNSKEARIQNNLQVLNRILRFLGMDGKQNLSPSTDIAPKRNSAEEFAYVPFIRAARVVAYEISYDDTIPGRLVKDI